MARNDLEVRRKARGLKQKDVERETGVQQPVLSAWEQGRVPMAVRHAMRLAKCYGTSVEVLFAFVEQPDEEEDVERPTLTGTEG